MRGKALLIACVGALATTGAAGAATGGMHPELGARLSGMGEHGIVNLTLKETHHEICWTFDIPTQGVTTASVRDKAGMVVAKLGTAYSKKGCAMTSVTALGLLDKSPAKYSVWVDTKGHPGDLRGKLFAGMAHM